MEAPLVLPRPTSPRPYASVPASPRRHIISSFPEYFYSIPTSPTKGLSAFVASCESKLHAPRATVAFSEANYYDDDDDDDDDDEGFSFSTGQSFRSLSPYPHEPQRQQGPVDDPPARPMAFADELFHNGRLLPLKLPPRLRHISPQSSPTSSPRSPRSLLRRGFPRLDFGKKEFDPFMSAIKQIRKEGAAWCDKPGHRRARSFDPTGTRWTDGPAGGRTDCEQDGELLTESKRKSSKRSKMFWFKGATKRKSSEAPKSEGSKPKDGSGWSKLTLRLRRLLALPSDKGEAAGSVISVQKTKDGLDQREQESSQTRVAVRATSTTLTCDRCNAEGPKLLDCFGVAPVSPTV